MDNLCQMAVVMVTSMPGCHLSSHFQSRLCCLLSRIASALYTMWLLARVSVAREDDCIDENSLFYSIRLKHIDQKRIWYLGVTGFFSSWLVCLYA